MVHRMAMIVTRMSLGYSGRPMFFDKRPPKFTGQ